MSSSKSGSIDPACTRTPATPTNASRAGSVPIDPARIDGGDPDLQLDAHDRPRIAFHWQDDPQLFQGQLGVGYAWCDTNCESPGAVFQHALTEESAALDTDWPLTRPLNCRYAHWLDGYRPSLTLDGMGNPRIAVDADFVAFDCVGVPEPGGGLPVGSERTHSGVRYISLMPGDGTQQRHVFLAFLRR
jgi:hypothetical protein